MIFWSLLSLLTAAYASPVEVKLTYEVRLYGQQICNGTQVIETGRAFELCARHYDDGNVKFRAKVSPAKEGRFMITGYITKHDKDGMPTSLSSPQISALAGERAEISAADENDFEAMGFAVLVNPL